MRVQQHQRYPAPIALGGSSRTFNVDDTAAIPDLNLRCYFWWWRNYKDWDWLNESGKCRQFIYRGSTTANQGILRIAAFGGTIPNGSALIVNSTLDLNGYSETVGSLAGSGTLPVMLVQQ
jgi:hypothetical protein